ncbi:MAG TPA: hypothetical protein VH396_17670 [Chitinophagaceae bacterium]|jgi:hypothetical protein
MPKRAATIYNRISNHLLEVSLDKITWINVIDAEETMNTEHLALIDDLLQKEFGLTSGLIKMIKLLGGVIKEQFFVNFYYESHAKTKNEFKAWRKVEPYMIGIYISGAKKGKVSLTGYFTPTPQQIKQGKEKGQGNYDVDKIDLNKFKILKQTFDSVKIPRPNIYDTKTMAIFYKTNLQKFYP